MGLPRYKTAAVISSIVGAWAVAAPFALPIHKQLNPRLLNIDPPAPVHSIPRIIVVDDAPLPQINRKVIPQSSPPDNPPPGRRASVPASIGTADASYYAQPRDKFPFPDAVTSQPTPNRAWLAAVDAWRVAPDQTQQRRKTIPGSLLDNTPSIDPPPGAARNRIVSVEDAPLPPTNRKLPQGIDAPPPRRVVVSFPNLPDASYWQQQRRQTLPGNLLDSAASVDAPPPKRVTPQAVTVDAPYWQQQRRQTLPGSLLDNAPSIDPPPGSARSRIVTVDDAPLPPTNRKLVQPFVAAATIDNPPFSFKKFGWGEGSPVVTAISGGDLIQSVTDYAPGIQPRWYSEVLGAWIVADPPAQTNRKLGALLGSIIPQIDQPPGSARSRIVSIDDAPLPATNRKLNPSLLNVVVSVQIDNPPFGQKKFSWGEGSPVVTAISGGDLIQSYPDSAPGIQPRWYSAVLGAWVVADPPRQTRRFVTVDGAPAVQPTIDQPPGRARSRIVSVDDGPLPPTNKKLNPSLINVVPQIDNPPFGQVRSKDPWRSWTNDPLPQLNHKLNGDQYGPPSDQGENNNDQGQNGGIHRIRQTHVRRLGRQQHETVEEHRARVSREMDGDQTPAKVETKIVPAVPSVPTKANKPAYVKLDTAPLKELLARLEALEAEKRATELTAKVETALTEAATSDLLNRQRMDEENALAAILIAELS